MPPTDSELLWRLVVLAGVVLGPVVSVATLVRMGRSQRRLIEPMPLEVKAAADFVSRKDFDHHVAETRQVHSQIFAKLSGMERGIREEMRDDLKQIRLEISGLAREVGSLTTSTSAQNQSLASMSAKLDRVAETAAAAAAKAAGGNP